MEDKRITELFLERKNNAVDELLNKYGKLFKNIALNVLNNELDAEECVNDACMEIWNAIPPSNPEYLMAFSCKIVRRVSINRLKHNLRQKRNSDDTLHISELLECIPTIDATTDYVDSSHLHTVINDFLRSVDEESRVLFVRRYFFLESVAFLAEKFDMSENAISVKLHRTRKKLLSRLKREGIYEQRK